MPLRSTRLREELKDAALRATCIDYSRQAVKTTNGRRKFLEAIHRIKSRYKRSIRTRAVREDAALLDEATIDAIDLERQQGDEDGGV